MKSTFGKSAITMAVAGFAASGIVMAETVTTQTTNLVDVEMSKRLSLSKEITIDGGINVRGALVPDSSAVAVIDDKQFNSGNSGGQVMTSNSVATNSNGPAQNLDLLNEASSSDDMLNGASGNVAVNINGGDNNMQDNASALASADDTRFVFGLVDAEVFVHQDANQNTTANHNVENLARIGQRSFHSASGNIGVNFAAGNSNLQKNNFASSVASAGVAEASVNTQQHSTANLTINQGEYVPVINGEPGVVTGEMKTQSVAFTTPGDQPLSGFGQGNMSGSYGNTIVIPGGDTEENGSFLVDSTPSPANLYSSQHSGGIGANESSMYEFAALFTGELPYYEITECGACIGVGGTTFATNTVTLDNQAFMGAGGNIGANMASGNGNLQSNSLAMSVTPPAQ